MPLRFGPFAFGLPVTDDATYGKLLTHVLDMVIPAHEIIRRGGVELSSQDPGGNFERWLPPFRNHMLACQDVHNLLVSVRPAGSLFGIHKLLIRLVKTYAYAVADFADHCAAWATDDIDIDAARKYERNGRTWETLIKRYARDLQRRWERLHGEERQRLAAMLGSDEFPEQLEPLLYPGGFIWTSF